MDTTTTIARFGLALVIGILVGLQREYAHQQAERGLFAGYARTVVVLSDCKRNRLWDIDGGGVHSVPDSEEPTGSRWKKRWLKQTG